MNISSLNAHRNEPMYGWALDRLGKPVPIAAAIRGELYRCPICHGDVVAKLGEIKQHHFAHLTLVQCTPENVARAVAGLWLADQLRERLTKSQPALVTWSSQDKSEEHTLDILKGIASVVQNKDMEFGVGDVVLLNQEGKPQTIILLGMENRLPEQAQIETWREQKISAILLNPTGVRSGQMNLEQLLEQSTLLGAWQLIGQQSVPGGVITDGEVIRAALKDAVEKPPFVFYRQLTTLEGMQHILEMDGKKLWLPPDLWEQVIGGSKNKLQHDVQVMIKEWAQEDGDTIVLFYITLPDGNAIALRRYDAKEPFRVRLDGSVLAVKRVTVLDVARQLVGHSMELPR